MSNVNDWNLPPRLFESLNKAGLLTPQSVILLSSAELRKVCNFSEEDCELVSLQAAQQILPKGFVSALDAEQVFAHKWCLLSVGCPKLDEFLGGGVAVRGITELAGESGSGKTQLCLQMCLSVQYPEINGGLGAGSVYINTEDIFPSRRLHQLIQKFPSRFHSEDTSIQFGNNIFIEHIADVESLKKCVFGQLPQLLAQKSVGLIVVDSIAGVFRADFEPRDSVSRAKEMRAVGGQLHRLAEEFRVAIICVNQVTTVINNERSAGDNTGRKTVAALGLAWANMVTTRLQVSAPTVASLMPKVHPCL